MPESVILIGGSGHAKVIIDGIQAAGDHVAGILDDGIVPGTAVLDVPVLGSVGNYRAFSAHKFLIAIGNNGIRRRIAEKLNVSWYTAIHPTAVVSGYAHIDPGTVVMPNAVINADAKIGAHCIINSGAIVEHDDVLADYVHLSPGAALGGTVRVGAQTHIGIGVVVKNNLNICGACTIGAGAVVVKDITEPGTYAGIPARRMK